MKYDVIVSNYAHNDLGEINKYISWYLHNEKAANKLINKILNKIKELSIFPKRYQLCEKTTLSKKGIRYLLANNFKIFFFIDEEKKIVIILRIIYNKRKINDSIFEI